MMILELPKLQLSVASARVTMAGWKYLPIVFMIAVFSQRVASAKLPQTYLNIKESQMELFAKSYLLRFNYWNLSMDNSFVKEPYAMQDLRRKNTAYRAAVKRFQSTWGLKETGNLDSATSKLMTRPRCGNPDIVVEMSPEARRNKRYTHYGERWLTNEVTYKLQYLKSASVTLNDYRTTIARAFAIWSSVSPLTFKEVAIDQPAHIYISFQRYYHGDSAPFDGPGGILAHAYAPPDGSTHFDVDEKFVVNSTDEAGTDFLVVAAHELGHALGLGHTYQYNALMAPFYKNYYNGHNLLHLDDIRAIQARYGAPSSADQQATSVQAPAGTSNTEYSGSTSSNQSQSTTVILTSDSTFSSQSPSTIGILTNDSTSLFSQSPSTTESSTSASSNEPSTKPLPTSRPNSSKVHSRLSALPTSTSTSSKAITSTTASNTTTISPMPSTTDSSNVIPSEDSWSYCSRPRLDTFTLHQSGSRGLQLYAFHKDQVILIDEMFSVVPGYPKFIKEVFPGLPADLDAALYYGPDDGHRPPSAYRRTSLLFDGDDPRTYFFQNDLFWEYRDHTLQSGYPRKIRDYWYGVPDNIDTAFVWGGNGRIYFTKGNYYYRFNTQGATTDYGYPKYLSGIWESLPMDLDAAMKLSTTDVTGRLQNHTYFFKGAYYYRYTGDSLLLDKWYPKDTSLHWFGCRQRYARQATPELMRPDHVNRDPHLSRDQYRRGEEGVYSAGSRHSVHMLELMVSAYLALAHWYLQCLRD